MSGAADPQRWDAAAMLDALPELVNRFRVADLAITYCYAAWADQYDVTPDEAIGLPLDRLLSEDELDGLHTQLALLGPDHPVVEDDRARTSRQHPGQWIAWVDRYLEGPDGAEVLSVGCDVTARHLAETRLAASEIATTHQSTARSGTITCIVAAPTIAIEVCALGIE